MVFSHIRGDISIKQASMKTNFTVDLIWWGSLSLAYIKHQQLKYLHISNACTTSNKIVSAQICGLGIILFIPLVWSAYTYIKIKVISS